MDPNRFVERMLNHMYDATTFALQGEYPAAVAQWQEVKDNLSDLNDWLEKGGDPPTLDFRFNIDDDE